MDSVCESCGDEYAVEPDAFGDGDIVYWPQVMAEQAGANKPQIVQTPRQCCSRS